MSRNSITPSRALRTIGERVRTSGGSPFGPGRQSRTPQAQLVTGFGEPTSSTRHIRQLPAIDSRSWKQKIGISAPATSHACKSVGRNVDLFAVDDELGHAAYSMVPQRTVVHSCAVVTP